MSMQISVMRIPAEDRAKYIRLLTTPFHLVTDEDRSWMADYGRRCWEAYHRNCSIHKTAEEILGFDKRKRP